MSAPDAIAPPPPASSAAPGRVVIVGGGLAGMAAAVALTSAGAAVTLLEARRSPGGRAGSFDDPQTGDQLDNCQHVLLGCCTNLRDFYARVGAADLIRYDRTIRFLDAAGRAYDLAGTRGLPAPLHLGPAFARFGLLTFREKIAAARAMRAMLKLGRAGRLALADTSFGDWLDAHRQPASLVPKLYDPVLVGALNEDCRRASAAYAIQVFQDAMLAHAGGYVVGVPNVPLSRLYASLPGVDVRFGARMRGLAFAGRHVTGVELADGATLAADAVVLATGHHSARRAVPDELAATDDRFPRLAGLEDVPILGVHLWFDRPVLAAPHVALVEGPLQWLFRKDADGRSLHGVISAARDWVGRPPAECLPLFEAQVRRVLPAARGAALVRGVVVVEKRATFSPVPGVDRSRPNQAPPPGGIENLYLAGDYTLTGWPATMEGAVRSGYLAAEAVLRAAVAGPAGRRFLVPDLPVQWPARLAGL
ncbi:MAG: Carotene 7,8-desaturase [Phycisphaerales bacterium]|nr:Carotene 7,8-desaturase [Phycisphaerales bacterium]